MRLISWADSTLRSFRLHSGSGDFLLSLVTDLRRFGLEKTLGFFSSSADLDELRGKTFFGASC
jgi:hypothetical protein